MPCYHPITAYQAEPGTPLIFAEPQWGSTHRGGGYRQLQIACGQCSGCRLKRSRDWAMRCLHEAKMHRCNTFVTLTYDAAHIPANNNLQYNDFRLFLRRLRKKAKKQSKQSTNNGHHQVNIHPTRDTKASDGGLKLGAHDTDSTRSWLSSEKSGNPSSLHGQPYSGSQIRYYMAGEYGEQFGRPHYHAILFGIDFTDKLYHGRSPAGEKIYKSATLEQLWPHGYSSIGNVTFESAAYIARYVMKKRTGDGEKEYKILNVETGEIVSKKKEFNQMSRRPGIGGTWLEKYHPEVYTKGKIIVRGHETNPPRYYDKLAEKLTPDALEDTKHWRYLEQLAQTEHHTPERLAVQEQVALAKTKSLKRKID